MHFKDNPQHKPAQGFLPTSLSDEMIQQFMGFASSPFINIKWCAKCPSCKAINPKKGKNNQLVCSLCN